MTTETTTRRYDLDWLRIFGILIVFLYHSCRFFDLTDWHLKNSNTYVWLEVWNVFATRWMMPLFFIISGASLFYAVGKSSGWRRFYVAKFLRLMIPVLIASVTHSVLQVYLDRLTHAQFTGSFFAFIPEYFNGIYMAIGMPGNFAFHGMHLWYLLFLFLYSLICYRLFVWARGSGQEMLNRFTTLLLLPGLMYVWLPIPLLAIKALIPQGILKAGAGGWGFVYYLWFLIAGFLIASNDRLQQQIKHQRWISFILSVVLATAYLYQLFGRARVEFTGWIGDWILVLLSFVSASCLLLTILGFGLRFLSFDRPMRRYANDGVLPFYILHQTVLLCVGYFIMAWDIHDVLKWALAFTISFIVIITLYTQLVRKFDLLRFLFGMKTTHPFFDVFRNRSILIVLHVLYLGLIAFAVVSQISEAGTRRSPMPMMYDPEHDILLSSESITDRSSAGLRVVIDEAASKGKAIEFISGANDRPEAQPAVYIEMRFAALAGRYFVWLRGKSDVNNGYTDSVWLQVNDHIGTRGGGVRLGNWLDVHPAGIYGWAGDTDDPISIQLKSTGEHRIRIQPRQTPHRIDQIWLSRTQHRIPNTTQPIK